MPQTGNQFDRYQRQRLLPQIGSAGQALLAQARVLLVGCGALGGHLADQLVRGGVGFLRLADRDIVELTNLQRQPLFDERDAAAGAAKAPAAAKRLHEINSSVIVEPVVADVWAGNIEELLEGITLILDGTDNVQTRYLLNDAAVKHNIPWIHGACVGTEGRVMAIQPGKGPCLRCVFPTPPSGSELPTCDTAGVLQAAAAIVAGLQVAQALRILTSQWTAEDQRLWKLDVWSPRLTAIDLSAERRDDCPCCGRRDFAFLQTSAAESTVAICGRNAVQIRPARSWNGSELDRALQRLKQAGDVEAGTFFWRCRLTEMPGLTLTCFRDGRLLVDGTTDAGRAKAICARYIGA
jgi:molybdopterin-synthase adenylyltransferase